MRFPTTVKHLRLAAARSINSNLQLADHLYDLADGLIEEKRDNRGRIRIDSNKIGYNPRTRIKLLVRSLIELTNIYGSDISSKQLSYANDLVEEVEVGYLGDTEIESDFAKELEEDALVVSEKEAESSLQLRIMRIFEELISNPPTASLDSNQST